VLESVHVLGLNGIIRLYDRAIKVRRYPKIQRFTSDILKCYK